MMIIPFFPTTLGLAIWLEYIPSKVGKTQLELRVLLENSELAVINMEIEAFALQSSAISIPRFPCSLQQPGDLIIKVAFDGNEFKEIKRLHVQVGDVDGLLPGWSGAPAA